MDNGDVEIKSENTIGVFLGMIRKLQTSVLAIIVLLLVLIEIPTVEAGICFEYSEEIGMVCDGRIEPEPIQFEQPEEFEGSLLERVTYAYIEDNANIYPEPSLSVAPKYNVGVGFLYVTVQGQLTANGHEWFVVNPGEYALAKDIRVVQTPDFHGVEINIQPVRPFGWFVQDVIPSKEPDGEPDPDFNKLERFTFFQIYDAEIGEDNWIWYEIGSGRWVRQTYVSIVDVNKLPEDVKGDEYWVEVDLYEQTFAAYQGSRMVYAGLVSSGLNRWPTHEGIFQVFSSYHQTKMSGAEGKVDYYFIEDVPFTMYFDRRNEIALHGAYWHDRYGYKHSHGCVNMPPRDAEWVYHWSEEAPNNLWVWVHTSDPHHYFERFGGENQATVNPS